MDLSSWVVIGLVFLLCVMLFSSCVGPHRRGRLVGQRRGYPVRPVNTEARPVDGVARGDRDEAFPRPIGVRPDEQMHRLSLDGRERTFFVHVPAAYSSARPVPVVFVFHGGGRGSGRGIARRTGFNRLADAHGFLAVYPDGYRSNWNDGRGTTDAERAGVDDVSFVRLMLRELEDRFAIDRRRIYAVGVSNGGMFVNRLGCELADRFAAIAFVVGPMPAPVAPRCEPRRPISVLGIFGTEDPLIPWRGGEVRGGDGGPILGVEETIDLWVRRNGCRARGYTEVLPRRVDDGTVVKRTTYRGCREEREVVLYTIEGGGHVWPPAKPASRRAGRSSQNIDASQAIWAFFSAQPPR